MLKFLLYTFCLLPFIFPMPFLGTDIQFYAFLVSLIYVFYKSPLYFTSKLKIIFCYSVLSVIIGLICADNVFVLFKCLFQYVSLFVVTFAIFNLLTRDKGLDEKYCKWIILLWFMVGFIQMFVNPDFCKFLVSNSRTTLDRGVASLASEPSFYGIQCFYFMFISSLFTKERNIYVILILLMTLFFAQSLVGIIFVFFAVLVLYGHKFNLKKLSIKHSLIFIVLLFVVSYMFVTSLKDSRIGMLATMLFSGQTLFIEDESSAVRLQAITTAIMDSFNSSFMPAGFKSRIGSMFGGILVEFGVFGLGLMFIITNSFVTFAKSILIKNIAFIVFFFLLFTNMQLANPSLSFVLALSLYYNRNRLIPKL